MFSKMNIFSYLFTNYSNNHLLALSGNKNWQLNAYSNKPTFFKSHHVITVNVFHTQLSEMFYFSI